MGPFGVQIPLFWGSICLESALDRPNGGLNGVQMGSFRGPIRGYAPSNTPKWVPNGVQMGSNGLLLGVQIPPNLQSAGQ